MLGDSDPQGEVFWKGDSYATYPTGYGKDTLLVGTISNDEGSSSKLKIASPNAYSSAWLEVGLGNVILRAIGCILLRYLKIVKERWLLARLHKIDGKFSMKLAEDWSI